MPNRTSASININVGGRTVTLTAVDRIGAEDAYHVNFMAALHRRLTKNKEDPFSPTPREVKDFIIRLNLFI